MADLLNLMNELDEANYQEEGINDDNDDDVKATNFDDDNVNEDDEAKAGRPSLAGTEVTEATEPMTSEDWGSPVSAEIPAALQDAQEKRYEDTDDIIFETNEHDGLFEEATKHVENELYTRLHHHWMQERHCPELLAYDTEMVQAVKQQIEERQDLIDRLEANSDAVLVLMATMIQLDLDRIKFVLSDWLSTRLAKIEAHPLHMRESIDRMSRLEIMYLKHYGALVENHLRRTVLDHIPKDWDALDDPNMIDKPNDEAYHFWLVKEPIDIRDMEQQDAGTCLVARYKDMLEPFREGKVELQL